MTGKRREGSKPTIPDVAKLAGVSTATVSRVLNGGTNVSAERRERVLRALRETGYVANEQARAMRTGRSRTIGVLVERIPDLFDPTLIACLGRALSDRGFSMALWTRDSPSGEAAAIAAVRGRAADGLLINAIIPDDVFVEAADQGVPMVLVNLTTDRLFCDQVTSDHAESGRRAARYLLRHGRSDLAVVHGVGRAAQERCDGFVEELAVADVEVTPERIVESEYEYDAARDAGLRLLSSGVPPHAVFCVAPVYAYALLDAAGQLGIEVPRDLWVVSYGYGVQPIVGWRVHNLTAVEPHVEQIAHQAVELLLARIAGERREPERFTIPGEFVVRGSTDDQPA